VARYVIEKTSGILKTLQYVQVELSSEDYQFDPLYERWGHIESEVSQFVRAEDRLDDARRAFQTLLQQELELRFAQQARDEARRPLDHKKFLDMLVDEMEDKYIELLEGTRAHTANIDAYIKRLTTSLDDDFNTQFYYPPFRKVREASQLWDVQMGQVETTNVLANNRSFAKVTPEATMEFDLPKRDIVIAEAMDGAKAMIDDFGALAQDPTFLAMARLGSGLSTASQLEGASGGLSTVRNVPPTLEIEVLDPNADAQGRPAIELNHDKCGNLLVDIPPAVLVHRYYYTGDRSFQAQLLPGGPSIVVAHHPKTGERCYITVQMLPGAPRVTCTKNSIEYDFGQNGITVHFPWIGRPNVKYRSGVPLQRRIGNLVHADQWREGAARCAEHTVAAVDHTKNMACGAAAGLNDQAKTALLPGANIVRGLPGVSTIASTDWEERLTIRAAEYRRDHEIKRAEKEQRRWEYSLPTIR